MKRKIVVVLVGLMCLSGCASMKTKVPVGCEHSVLYELAPWSFLTLRAGAVSAKQFMAKEDYALLSKAARLVADELESGADWSKVKEIPLWTRIIASDVLPLLWDRSMLDECDRKYLIGFLRSF